MCPRGVRVQFELAWRDVWRIRSWPNLGGRPSPANHRHPHQVPFVSGEGWLFVSGEGWRCSLLLDYSGCWGLRSRGLPRLERGLVRARVRVTLDDGGHRYSQREQLMSDGSHDQVTVPDNLHDEWIGATASANSDGRHETDERIRSEDPRLATDRLSQHTHVQQVAGGSPVDRCGGLGC